MGPLHSIKNSKRLGISGEIFFLDIFMANAG